MRTIPQSVKYVARHKYAWPGGYPMFVIMDDGGVLCAECTHAEWRQVAHDTVKEWSGGWCASAGDVNWEDESLICDHCGDPIESAYGSE